MKLHVIFPHHHFISLLTGLESPAKLFETHPRHHHHESNRNVPMKINRATNQSTKQTEQPAYLQIIGANTPLWTLHEANHHWIMHQTLFVPRKYRAISRKDDLHAVPKSFTDHNWMHPRSVSEGRRIARIYSPKTT